MLPSQRTGSGSLGVIVSCLCFLALVPFPLLTDGSNVTLSEWRSLRNAAMIASNISGVPASAYRSHEISNRRVDRPNTYDTRRSFDIASRLRRIRFLQITPSRTQFTRTIVTGVRCSLDQVLRIRPPEHRQGPIVLCRALAP